jgi:hypothetical protein
MKGRIVLFLMLGIALTGCGRSAPETAEVSSSQNTSPPGGIPIKAAVLAAATPVGHCSFDLIDGKRVPHDDGVFPLSSGRKFLAHGWVVDDQDKPPTDFQLVLDSATNYGFAGQTDELRTDVIQVLKSEAAALSGFNVSVDLGQIPAGTYTVTLLFPGPHGDLKCTPAGKLAITADKANPASE